MASAHVLTFFVIGHNTIIINIPEIFQDTVHSFARLTVTKFKEGIYEMIYEPSKCLEYIISISIKELK